jgi:hypothetical protein
VKGAVWAVLGILALNVLLVGVLWIAVAVQHTRRARAQRRLEARWRIPTLPTAETMRRRPRGRFAYAGIAVAGVVAFAGLAALRPTHGVTSAVATMVNGSEGSSGGLDGRAIAPAEDPHAHAHDVARVGGGAKRSSTSVVPPTSDTTTVIPGSDGADLGAPSTVAATSTSPSSIRLAWTGVPKASGYQVYRSTGTELWLAVATTDPSVTAYTDDGLEAGTTYFYRVVAITDTGTAPPSDVVSATTDAGPLDPPTLTCSSTSTDAIDLSWTDVTGETGYRIERSTDGSTDWTTIATTGQDVTVYTDAGLSAGTTYYFRVFAENDGGGSPASNVGSATTATDQAPASPQADITAP